MRKLYRSLFFLLSISFFLVIISFKNKKDDNKDKGYKEKIDVIFDTDANNETDDQHALAYLLFSRNIFKVEGVTTNATIAGGNIDLHYAEAKRVMQLCQAYGKIPLLKGANDSFDVIKQHINESIFDGSDAVDLIIKKAATHHKNKLVVIAVGKLTNIALALLKAPSITGNIRLVWLGSNYPKPGEYNLENDVSAMNYVLASNVHFEMVMVRYGEPSGTDVVRISKNEVLTKMPGLGPHIKDSILGRYGGRFNDFGDYSVNLFANAKYKYKGNPPSKSLFDMAAVAIVKDPTWAVATTIACPKMVDNVWMDQPNNKRKIIIWENFDSKRIMSDFF